MAQSAGTGSSASATQPGKKPVRVWIDMVADMFHFGHANALRQARQMGDILVVGVHPDSEVQANKGPSVMTEQERLIVVGACKWVDEVTLEAPYTTTLATLDKFNIDFTVHGEDISVNTEGKDSYEEVKAAGRFKYIKRSEGVSTTDIVGRMLLSTKEHFDNSITGEESMDTIEATKQQKARLIRTSTLRAFTEGQRLPEPHETVVYIDGAFDLFHSGHVAALKRARELGDYLVVGIHSDVEVNKRRGKNHPIMNLHERVMTVLSCRYVDDVVIGAPYQITREMIETLRLNIVVHGDDVPMLLPNEPDPFHAAKEMGVYREIKSTPGLTTQTIVDRVLSQLSKYQDRNTKRAIKDKQQEEIKAMLASKEKGKEEEQGTH